MFTNKSNIHDQLQVKTLYEYSKMNDSTLVYLKMSVFINFAYMNMDML